MQRSNFRRRLADTWHHTWLSGPKPSLIIANLVGLVVAVLASSFLGGRKFAGDQFLSWVFFALPWIGAANVVFLMTNWWLSAGHIADEDRTEIEQVKNILALSNSDESKLQNEHVAKLKLSLADDVGTLIYLALIPGIGRNMAGTGSVSKFSAALNGAKEKVEQLPNQNELSAKCREFIHHCGIVFADDRENVVNQESRKIVSDLGQDILNTLYRTG